MSRRRASSLRTRSCIDSRRSLVFGALHLNLFSLLTSHSSLAASCKFTLFVYIHIFVLNILLTIIYIYYRCARIHRSETLVSTRTPCCDRPRSTCIDSTGSQQASDFTLQITAYRQLLQENCPRPLTTSRPRLSSALRKHSYHPLYALWALSVTLLTFMFQ